ADFVAAGTGDVDVEAPGGGDLLGGPGEAGHRPGGVAGDEPTGQGGEADGGQADADVAPVQRVEHSIGIGLAAGDANRPPVGQGNREQAVAGPVVAHGGER